MFIVIVDQNLYYFELPLVDNKTNLFVLRIIITLIAIVDSIILLYYIIVLLLLLLLLLFIL